MKEQILAITGKPGLYRLLSQGKNMLIVENITTHHRMPAYASNKVVALSEVAIYTTGDDMPLFEVMDKVKAATESKPVSRAGFTDFAPETEDSEEAAAEEVK